MSEDTATQKLGLLLRRRVVLFALAMLTAVWAARWPLREALTPPDASRYWQRDCDVVMLKKGIDASPRLRDTAKWWTGDWIVCTGYWRPLSSYAFWLMCKAFGWQCHDRFHLVTGLSHLGACALLFLLVEAVSGRPVLALLALVLLNVGIPLPYLDAMVASPGIGEAARWVCIPDVWLAMCMIPALLMAWRGRVGWAIVLASMAAMCKETGFMAYPLVILFYWWRWRRLHRAFWALAAVAATLATVKLIGVGPGWILGSNRSLWLRMFRWLAGYPLNVLASNHAPWGIVGVGIAVAAVGWRSRWTRYGAIPAAVLLASVVYWFCAGGAEAGMTGAVVLTGVLEWQLVATTGVHVALWLICAYAGLKGPDRALIVLLVLGYLAVVLPGTIAPQAGRRSFYMAWMLSSAVKALCVWSLPVAFVGSHALLLSAQSNGAAPEPLTQANDDETREV
jgi:hypothetical protein